MSNRYLKLIVIILGSAALFMAIYIFTAKPSDQTIGSYRSSVDYPTTPVTLSLWLPAEEKDNLAPLIDEYRKLHPNVTVQVEAIDTATYQAKLLRAGGEDTLPDMFAFRGDGLPLYKNNLAPAPSSVYSSEQFGKTFADFATQQLTSGNTVYGAPLGLATLGLLYNQNRFDTAKVTATPTDWNQFQTVNDALRKKINQDLYESGVAFGTPSIHSYPDIISILMLQNGATMTDQPPTKATFELPDSAGYYPGAKAVEYYASFSQPSKQNYSWSDTLGDSVSALAQNKTAMIVDYPMVAKQVAAQNSTLPVKLAALPQTNTTGPINYGIVLTGGVAKTSKYTEIAWDFWGFMTSKPAQKQFSARSYWPASRKDLIVEQENDKDLAPFARQSATATDWYKGINSATNSDLRDMLSMYLGGLDAQIGVKNASTKITNTIEQVNAK